MFDSRTVIALLLVLCLQSETVSTPPPPLGIELPKGPAGEAWSKVPRPEGEWKIDPKWADGARERVTAADIWKDTSSWNEWAAMVDAEARAETPDEHRRGLLALMSWGQGRSDDAWEHFSALSTHPLAQTSVLPYLFPGGNAVEGWAIQWDADTTPYLLVGTGSLLAPALPPPSVHASEVVLGIGRIERRAMTIHGLHVGSAVIDFKVALEYEGLQIDVTHVSGGPAKFKVRLPVPLDFAIATVYVDWQRREGPTDADVELEIAPGSEPRTIFARYEPLYVRWPTIVPDALDARAQLHGFTLAVADDDPERAKVAGFAQAMAKLLGVRCDVATPAAALTRGADAGIVLDLSASSDRDRKFRGLVSQCERFALAHTKP